MDRVTTWLRDRIAECSPAPGRGLELVDKLAAATESIWRANSMVFGMVLPPRLSDRDVILAECATALRAWLPQIDDPELLQRLVDMERRTNLPLDAAPHLAKLVAAKRAE